MFKKFSIKVIIASSTIIGTQQVVNCFEGYFEKPKIIIVGGGTGGTTFFFFFL